jgi:hypothetical protein
MTNELHFTSDEWQLIVDALSTHAQRVRELNAKNGVRGESVGRLKELGKLQAKVIAQINHMENEDARIRPSGSADDGSPDGGDPRA